MPKPVRVAVVPYADDPQHCLLITLSDGHGMPIGREEVDPLVAELLRHLPPARVAALARQLLARPEVQRAESELTTARLMADLEGDGGAGEVDAAGMAWEVAAEQASPEERATGEQIAERQAGERAAVAGLFDELGRLRRG